MQTFVKRYARRFGHRPLLLAAATGPTIERLESRQLLSTTYYVSPAGSDSNAGTSTGSSWASVAKVDATSFLPGDQILFQSGGEWHGQLTASSSGTAGNPIVYGSYNSGAKPIFDGSDVIPTSAFTLVSGSTYQFSVSSVPNTGGNAYWVYANHAGMLAAAASDASSGGVQANTNSFYINGATVYINTGGSNPATNGLVYTLGDRGAGQAANSSLINSNGQSYVTFQNIEGRETAEVGGGNQLTGGISDGYVFRIQGGSNISLINDDGEYGSKHIYGEIDTSGFLGQGDTAEGAPEGVSGNTLPYGNATAFVAYADNNNGNTADTQTYINDSVTNYDGSQPAFLTHANDAGDISNLTITNFVSVGSPVALETPGGETINYTGGSITNNSLEVDAPPSGAPASPLTVNGVTITGSGSAYTQLLVGGGVTVENCVVTYGNQGGIQVLGPNNTIRFNTLVPLFYASGIALQNNAGDGPTTGEKIYGNIFTGSSNGISVSSGDTFTADYDFFDSGQGSPSFNVNGTTESLATFQAAGYETHATVGTPAFVSPTSGNYTLTSTSQAINTVPTSVVTPALTTDILGDARPSANIYDAGAYEYQSVLHQPTVATPPAASPSTVTGTTTNLSVLGASPDGEPTLLYNWSATGPGTVTYSANGTNAAKNTTATFSAAGTYTFTANIGNGQYSTTSSVNVTVNQVSQGLSITPSQWFVSINTTKQFTASVNDQFGNPISGPTITYSIQSGPGSINGTGLFTAGGTTGTTIIKATSGGVSSTATANVVPPNAAPTVATAASCNPNPVTGTTAQLSALGADDNGEGNLTYTWSTVGTPPATVGFSANGINAAKNTTATFTANGNYNFLVTIVDQGGLSTTSSVTVTVNTFVPIVLDGTKDGRYGNPLAVQDVATNYGNNNLGSPVAPYSQLSAAYGVIDQPDGQFDLFLAGSLDLVNAHLDLLIDSVPGQGASNLNQLANTSPWGGSPFSNATLDTGFRPDHIFTSTFGGGSSLSYYNFDTNASDNNNLTDPANGVATSSGSVIPYFQERVNNAASNTIVQPANAAALTTGAEFAFSLSGLGYTSADYSAGDSIGVMVLISYGSHYQYTNQWLAPLNPGASEASNNYFPIDLSNASQFPGNQFVSVPVPAGYQGPTVATAAAVNPSPVTGSTATLSVLGSDPAGESNLTYTWSTTGTPPATVSYSANGTNAAKNVTATFTANGSYNFLVTIKDASGLTTTSTVTVSVTGAGTGNQAPTVATAAAASPATVTGTTTALSALGADDGGEANLTYTWATTGTPPAAVTFSANGTNASKNDTATFTKAGSYSFQVTIKDAQGLTTVSSVTVTVNQTATTLTLSPATVSVVSGNTQQFTASVTDQFGAAISSPSLTWSVFSGSGSISASGLYTAPAAAGSATVKAVSGSANGTAAITVTNSAPTVATAASASPSPVTGTTTTLAVLGADDGGESKLTYIWATTGTPPAAVTYSANGTNASKSTTATFTKAGAYSFQVTITDAAGLTTTSTVSVTVNQTATIVTLSPTSASVATNGTQQFTAAVKDQFGTAIASPSVTWSISAGTGTVSASGLYTAPAAAGSATVKAVSGSVSATAVVTVTATNQAPTVATAASATPSPVTGTTTALSVLGADDGGEANLTYTWATTGTPPAAVTFSANGTNASKATTATFTKAGSYTFQVTIKDVPGLTTTSSVTVTVNQTATAVTLSPASASVATSATQQFTATVKDQFGTTISSPSVTWSISAGTGTVNASGLYTAPGAAGSATVKAVSGSASGTAAVTVTATNQAPTVATAATASPSPVTGTTTALSVLGADDGGEANLTYTWATTGTPPAAVTFSANGTNTSKSSTATFAKAGSYTFQVTIKDVPGLTTTSSVTVTVNQTATTVTVSPSTVSVNVNGTQQFTAAVNDQFGTAISSPLVTWSVSAGTGSVSASGLYTAPAAAGSATVKAVSGAVNGTAGVTVTAPSGSLVTVDGTLDTSYGTPLIIQSQATNFGNGNYTGAFGSGASAPYSQLSAGYSLIDEANNQFDLFIAGSLNLSNAHFDLLLDSVPGAGVSNLSSLNNVGPYGTQFPTIILDNGFRPDHIFTLAYGGGTSVDYVNLDTGPSSHVGFTESDPAAGLVTNNVSGVPAFSVRVNNALQNTIVAAGAGGSAATGIELQFSLSGLGYTLANYNAGVPIGVAAMITQGSQTVMTNQILAPYTPNQTYLNQDSGTYTFIGNNFNFSDGSKFSGNQFFQAPTPAVTVNGTLDARYGTADVIQNQATNYGNGNYTGVYGSGASAPYSQLSAGYTLIDEAHNQLDLFIAGSLNLSNAHLDLLIDSIPGTGVANLSSLTNVGPYGTSFPTIVLDAGFRPDHIFTFAYGGGTSVDYVNLDTGGSSHVGFTQPDPSSGLVNESVTGVPSYQMAINNADQGSIIAAGAGGSVTTGIEIAFSLTGLGYTAASYAAGTPINVSAMISYGSHTVGTNQILGGYVPNQNEINNNGGVYTFIGGNFDFSNQARFAGNQFFTASTTPLYAVAAAGTAIAGFTSDAPYESGASNLGTTSDAIDLSSDTSGVPMSLYQTERYGPTFNYSFGGFVAGSTHTLTMAFAETYWTGVGQRVFSVSANGTALLTNFDVFAAAGGRDKGINETFTVTADSNGNIVLAFTSSVDQAKICGVEIY